jgi:hypothetical protein
MINEIESIKERNRRVETDKAWETSKTRRIIVALMTYVIILIFLLLIGAPYPFLNAIVPTAGFVLSTLTLPFFKKWWINNFYKK